MESQDGVVPFGPSIALPDMHDPISGKYLRLRPLPLHPTFSGTGITIAVIDSGVLSEHPDIAPNLVCEIDFTGAGMEPQDGHGTAVTLRLLQGTPDVDIVSVKVIDVPPSERSVLIEALNWVRERDDIDVVNMSLGSINLLCEGACDICRAAMAVSDSGKQVVAAAGNTPHLTACPGKAERGVFTVAEASRDSGGLTETSGSATADGLAAYGVDPESIYYG